MTLNRFVKNVELQVKQSTFLFFYLLNDPGAMFTPQINQEEGTVLIVNSSMPWRNLKKIIVDYVT